MLRSCRSCVHFQPFEADIFSSYHGSRDFSKEEVIAGRHCYRLGTGKFFLTVPSSVCALHETKTEWKWFFWVKWLLPWVALFRTRKLAKKALEIDSSLRDDRHALRAALKCAFSGLRELFDLFRSQGQSSEKFVSPPERQLYNTLDNLGAVAKEPALADCIQDLGIKNAEEGKLY